MARSATYVAASRSGSEWTTSTSEPPRASGSVKEAIPGGEAGFASERRRPPSERGSRRRPLSTARRGCGRRSSPAVARSSALRRVVGDEGVGLGPDLDADVVHARRHAGRRTGRPAAAASRPAPAGRRRARPTAPASPGRRRRRPAVVVGADHASPTVQAAPRKTGPSQCVGRSTRRRWPRSRSCSSIEQRGGLRDPVRVRRRPTARPARRSPRRRT